MYGYEFYIIDGLDMVIVRFFICYKFYERIWNFGKLMFLKVFWKMFIKMFFFVNSGFGYVHDLYMWDVNLFSDWFFWGGGIGLDIVLFYDKVI